MNILITGGNGQLGKDCEKVFKKKHATTCIDIEELDITLSDQVDIIVKIGGYEVTTWLTPE